MDPLRPGDPGQVGPYRLEGRLGAGGMGQVFLGRSPGGMRVVVKVIRPEHAEDDKYRARFAREIAAAREVGGFYTAQVVDADPSADPPWMATAHIPGPSLRQAVGERGPLDADSVRALAAGLAEGLTAIHTCGLVHRDLKPANIILTADGPRIIDFGIARPLDADTMTRSGARIGTPSYMSPEQTEGKRAGPASDVFSLGTVLTYAATGRNPFAAEHQADIARRILGAVPNLAEVPSGLRPLIRACWAQDPGQRPALNEILAQFGTSHPGSWPPTHLADLLTEPGPAPRDASAEPAMRNGDRAPKTGDSSDRLRTSQPEPPRPSHPETRPRFPTRRRILLVGGVATAAAAIAAAALLWTSPPPSTADLWESSAPSTATLTGHEAPVLSVAFNPDGDTLASASQDQTARVWDTSTGEVLTPLTGHGNLVSSVTYSPDGTALATAGWDGTVRLWDAEVGEEIAAFDHEAPVHAAAFSPDGTTLATAGHDGAIRLWNVDDSGGEFATLTGHDGAVFAVAFSPDGTTLASAGQDGTVRRWDVVTGEPLANIPGHDELIAAVAFTPDGSTLATASHDGTVRLWDEDSEEPFATLDHDDVVWSVAVSPDGTALATGGGTLESDEPDSADDTIRLWDTDSGEVIATLNGDDAPVRSVAFSPDGSDLAVASQDGTVQLWSIR